MSRSIVTRHNKNEVIIKLWGGGSDKKINKKLIDLQASIKNGCQRYKLESDDMFNYHHIKEISDTWSFRSDGLSYYYDISDINKDERNKIKSK